MRFISPEMRQERKRLMLASVIPFLFVFLFVLVHVFQLGMHWDFTKAGVYPRTVEGLPGIITSIFIHGSWSHLLNNIVGFSILSWALFSSYRSISLPVFIYSWFFSGALLWIIGRPVYHIGCSGLIYAIAFFLFLSGILRKHPQLIALSLVVVFLYGGMVWQLIPWLPDYYISWEGHLAGAIVGMVLAIIYRKKGPQRPQMEADDDDDIEDTNVVRDEHEIEENNAVEGKKVGDVDNAKKVEVHEVPDLPEWMVSHSLEIRDRDK